VKIIFFKILVGVVNYVVVVVEVVAGWTKNWLKKS
jgi:hypothetical protein